MANIKSTLQIEDVIHFTSVYMTDNNSNTLQTDDALLLTSMYMTGNIKSR